MKGVELFLLFCCLWSLATFGSASEMEKALLKTMFNDYNSKVRPALQSEDRVVVRVGMVLSSFVGLNMKNEEMSTVVVMDLEWTDYRLAWNPKDYDGIEVMRIPSGKVWLPDIVLINKYVQALQKQSKPADVVMYVLDRMMTIRFVNFYSRQREVDLN